MKKITPMILIVFLTLILSFEIVFFVQKNNAIAAINNKIITNEDRKEELIITLFYQRIESDSSSFYDNYFNHKLEYYDYETKLLNIKEGRSPDRVKYVTFGSTPMIGAHNPVGYDVLTYKVDVLGNVSLDKFNHLKSFDIPEWLRTGIIKPYPEAN